jgi:hypothetical protein
MNTQTIWIVEFAPIPPQCVGGFDWYYTYEIAIKQFEDHRNNRSLKSHQIGIYSVRLPGDWDYRQIQAWTEDNTNVLPECPDEEHTLAPAAAGDD